jgi:hypothetical protein
VRWTKWKQHLIGGPRIARPNKPLAGTQASVMQFSRSKNSPNGVHCAREHRKFSHEIRELHFGLGSHPTHRALFTIRPDIVVVLTIRHVAQADLSGDENLGG